MNFRLDLLQIMAVCASKKEKKRRRKNARRMDSDLHLIFAELIIANFETTRRKRGERARKVEKKHTFFPWAMCAQSVQLFYPFAGCMQQHEKSVWVCMCVLADIAQQMNV